jgi:O-antigen ligase
MASEAKRRASAASLPAAGPVARASERAALWLLIAILAWMQFPLGSNRPWAWSFLVLLIALDWALWIPADLADGAAVARLARRLAIPGLLMVGVLVWVWLQSASFTPAAWHADIWTFISRALGKPVAGAVSFNPYATQTELMKLASYVAVGWLAAALSLRHDNARLLFVSVVAIATAYAVYGIVLSAFHTSQVTLFEGDPPPYERAVSGGLVAKNSFATFTGMAFLASLTLLVEAGQHRIVAMRGWRTHVRTLVQFATGKGAVWLIASLILFVALIGSQSRAGLIATLVGLMGVFALSLSVSARRGNTRWTLIGGGAAAVIIFALFLASGQSLQSRFEDLIETRGAGEIRPLMWDAAARAIADHPLLGTGLGTYPDIFNLYAKSFVPYVVDRAHNDYLEFAMGAGLPAATLWITALLIITAQCVSGVLKRHRRRGYALTAVGATLLVGFHSIFDFSLQMPAVAVLYAAILGIGIGQSQPTRESQQT